MKIDILEYNIDFLKMYLRLKGIIEKVLFKYVNTAKKYMFFWFFYKHDCDLESVIFFT